MSICICARLSLIHGFLTPESRHSRGGLCGFRIYNCPIILSNNFTVGCATAGIEGPITDYLGQDTNFCCDRTEIGVPLKPNTVLRSFIILFLYSRIHAPLRPVHVLYKTMGERLTYRRRHCYATRSNQRRVLRTPGELQATFAGVGSSGLGFCRRSLVLDIVVGNRA